MIPQTNILDHIVHLTPPGSLRETVKDFEDLGFTSDHPRFSMLEAESVHSVVPGGTHVGGLTSNALVVLQDGVYIELIVFNQPNPPKHGWGERNPGWIDYANLGTDEYLNNIINHRYQDGTSTLYEPPRNGGRKTEGDSPKELKWQTTNANEKISAGELPFFCRDLTPREWRVPASPSSNTEHRNKVLGVHTLTYITPASNFSTFAEQLSAVYGSQPRKHTSDSKTLSWDVRSPHDLGRGTVALVELRTTDESDTEEMKRGTGLWEVTLWTDEGTRGRVDSKWGRLCFVPIRED